MTPRIHHVAISVKDPIASKRLYDALFRELGGKEDLASIRLCTWTAGEVELLAYKEEIANAPHAFGTAGWQHVALQVDSAEIVDRVAQVVRHVARLVHEPREYPEYMTGYYAVFFEDEDDVRWEVMTSAGHK
jgi:catechol 2,3-dioxygenase-like lactoylglutathione lyase family enzyme